MLKQACYVAFNCRSLLAYRTNDIFSFCLFIIEWHHWDNLPEWTPGIIRRTSSTIGLLGLIVHRKVVEKDNLLAPPDHEVDRVPPPKGGCPYRPDDRYGTSVENSIASTEGAPIGRNMPAVEKVNRHPNGDPNAQMIAQRLLARESFKPARDQLNITAAAWIQAMAHSWIHHEDGVIISIGDGGEGATHDCPLVKFNFFRNERTSRRALQQQKDPMMGCLFCLWTERDASEEK